MTRIGLGAALAMLAGVAAAQERTIPSRSLPTPTDVSPQMQALISRPIAPTYNAVPQTPDEWLARQKASADSGACSQR